MNTVTLTLNAIGYELFAPVNTSLLPVEYTVAPLKIATGRARIRRPTALELVSETVDREIDVNELHDALGVLLVSHQRKQQAEGFTT